MRPAKFKLDRRVFELLKDEKCQRFTIRTLREAYAGAVCGLAADVALWRYINDQVVRLKRIGWVQLDPVRRRRDQVFHVQGRPDALELCLVDHHFVPETKRGNSHAVGLIVAPEACDDVCPGSRLEALSKELRLDMLTALGEAERYKQLFTEMPVLKDRLEQDYLEARDRSSRLLGHLRAVEKTLKSLAVV